MDGFFLIVGVLVRAFCDRFPADRSKSSVCRSVPLSPRERHFYIAEESDTKRDNCSVSNIVNLLGYHFETEGTVREPGSTVSLAPAWRKVEVPTLCRFKAVPTFSDRNAPPGQGVNLSPGRVSGSFVTPSVPFGFSLDPSRVFGVGQQGQV